MYFMKITTDKKFRGRGIVADHVRLNSTLSTVFITRTMLINMTNLAYFALEPTKFKSFNDTRILQLSCGIDKIILK